MRSRPFSPKHMPRAIKNSSGGMGSFSRKRSNRIQMTMTTPIRRKAAFIPKPRSV